MVPMSLYRLQDPQEDAHLHVERIKASPPHGVSVQQVEQQHNLVLILVAHMTEKAIKTQIWKTGSSQALPAQSCEQ